MPTSYLALTDADRAYLAEIGNLLQPRFEALVAEVVKLHQEASELQGMLSPESREARVRADLTRYVNVLREGRFEEYLELGEARARRRSAEGFTHAALAVAILGRQRAVGVVLRDARPEQENNTPYRQALQKFGNLYLIRSAEAHGRQQEATIRAQQEAMLALSTPVVQVRDGVLVAPLVGTIDSARAQQVTLALLSAIRDRQARVVILDISGVPIVDTQVANHLMKTLRAARLLGARGLVAGISPEIADTLVTADVLLVGIETHLSLQRALEAASAVFA
jgi:rsbT co-antagonist protein RsbR